MQKTFLLTALILLGSVLGFAQVKVTNLKCENMVNPLSIDITQPRFSWQLEAEKRNVMQTGYEIRVSESEDGLKDGSDLVWSSQEIKSDRSVFVTYEGPALESAKMYHWTVRIWDQDGSVSEWSAPANWKMGLLNKSDWKATWIKLAEEKDSVNRPSPLFRKEFKIEKEISAAFAYVTSQGLYEARINGQRVGDMYLTPGWTAYQERIQYQAYDVKNLLQQDKNAIGVTLGSGWFRGRIGWGKNMNFYGSELALLFQMEIRYTDGTIDYVNSDGTWKSSFGSIVYSDIYNGETIDARKEQAGWDKANFNETNWVPVAITEISNEVNIIATINEPIRKKEIFTAKELITTPEGDKVIDFGQNLVGWVQVKVKGNAGDKIMLTHAEVLDKFGNFYMDNIRSAKQLDTYILKGGSEEVFEPHFTFQGFRYIKVEGIEEIDLNNFTAVALYSDMNKTGEFSCSYPLLNQLQHNIQWGQRGNFLDVPTDCPQRDERLGWTGDAQAFSRTAAFNFDVNNFFTKWLKDVEADQQPNGAVPHVVPNVLGDMAVGATGWADAATIVPWNMYLAYGNKRILEDQYESMKSWVKFMEDKSINDLWNRGFHFGDWLFYRPDDDNSGRAAVTDKYMLAQCFYANSVQIMINSASVLGKDDDEAYYKELLGRVKKAYMAEYVTPNGRLVSSTQTAYVLALQFDMLPENLRAQAAKRLVQNIMDYSTHLTTGFLGTSYLPNVLTRFGYTDVAYKLLMQKTYPSWLYPVTMGATTIWERWDGIKPDSTFQTPSMNSFNHYAYGAIGDWLYRTVAGLEIYEDYPGYKQIKIKPHIGGDLTYAGASLETFYGELNSKWEITDKVTKLNITIPANTKAIVYLPCTDAGKVKEGGRSLKKVKGIEIKEQIENYIVINIGSGTYEFNCEK